MSGTSRQTLIYPILSVPDFASYGAVTAARPAGSRRDGLANKGEYGVAGRKRGARSPLGDSERTCGRCVPDRTGRVLPERERDAESAGERVARRGRVQRAHSERLAGVPIPAKLSQRGVTDMVRLSDGRMSGTGFGTVILHIAPEAAVGGPLALVETGDWITLDVEARQLTLEVDDAQLERRRSMWHAPPEASAMGGGYTWLYRRHVTQADQGVDFDFLLGSRGDQVPRDSH